MKKHIFIIIAAVLALVGCQPEPINQDDLFLTEEAAQALIDNEGGKLLTLNEFREQYMTKCGVIFPVRLRSYEYSGGQYQMDPTDYTKNNKGLFSIDTIPSAGQRIYIRGRVVTEDYAGNFYKSMVIQQIVDGKQQALRLSVDASSISGQYAIGQEIMICVNGLSIGKYANQPQLCVPAYNDNINANNATQKVGWAPGRIPAARFMSATKRIGLPEPEKIVCDTIKITDYTSILTDNEKIWEMDGKLVAIKDVHFTGQYSNYGELANCTDGNPETDEHANVFAPTTKNVGYPQGRVVMDDDNNPTIVSSSEYAKYARYYLPDSEYKGTVCGILGLYTDNGRNNPVALDWSITLRGLKFIGYGTVDDLLFYDTTDGQPWKPREYGK
ncbi:MAG: DUF5689 domain-containing protein [Paludibacteraceae bacterium]